jgi:polysaccharide pyruvyl transferase WcaK-like protein
MNNYFIYNHGGSANHGCEALVRTAAMLFSPEQPITLLTEGPGEDLRYELNAIADVRPATAAYSRISPAFLKAYLALKTKREYFLMDILPYRKAIRELRADQVEISVGGDIYCYEDYRKFILLHDMITRRGCKSVLLGCSLEEQLFRDPEFVADMKKYTYISARESLTYEMLKKAGITQIGLCPDGAFTLPKEELPLPKGFREGNTVGINLSPLVARKEAKPGIVLENYIRLVRYILEHTDCSVALIPHVVWQDNDDRTVLKELYDAVGCPERVILIEDHNCMQLKGFISRCRFFIGARTHATIAAYSTCVPTLVMGYSTKSRGIATDLFGTDDHYVLPVQELTAPEALTDAFRWIMEREQEIRSRLEAVMPEYITRAKGVKENVEAALKKV